MKRITTILLALLVLLTLCGCGRKSKDETAVIRIGVLEPLSGAYAEEGLRETLGIQFANETEPMIRLNGKNCRIELVLADDASSPEKAASAANELISAGCCAVIGSYGAELSSAASDAFRAAGVAALAVSCDDPQLTRGNDHYFRICALTELHGLAMAQFARATLGAKSVYCVVQAGSERDDALLSAFRKAAEPLDMTLTVSVLPGSTTDFVPCLKAAAEQEADVLFIPGAIEHAAELIDQAAAEEIALPILAGGGWNDAGIPTAVQEKGIAVYVVDDYAEGADSGFDKGFKDWLAGNEEAFAGNGGTDAVSPLSALGYDAYQTVLAAIRRAGSADKADVLAVLPGVSCAGVCGSFSFDDDGGALRSVLWVKKSNAETGEWDPAAKIKLD